jgi:hypothetical protein
MEDLRDTGRKVIESVTSLGHSDAGDLTLGIFDLIDELRDNSCDDDKGKLDHLYGLFREFTFGEEYELRDKEEKMLDRTDMFGFPGAVGALSGIYTPVSAIVPSGALGPISPITLQPIPSPASVPDYQRNPCGEVAATAPEECILPPPVTEDPPKVRWWHKLPRITLWT